MLLGDEAAARLDAMRAERYGVQVNLTRRSARVSTVSSPISRGKGATLDEAVMVCWDELMDGIARFESDPHYSEEMRAKRERLLSAVAASTG